MPVRSTSKPTIRDVAKAAGVSPITASRAFSNPGKVKNSTIELVQQAALEIGYIPNLAAGTLSSNVSKLIGVIVPSIANSFFSDILQAMTIELRKHGFQILLGNCGYDLKEENRLVHTFLGRGTDAIVLTGHMHDVNTVRVLKSSGIPVVEMLNIGSSSIDTTIGVSNFEAARAATTHLVELGRENVAYIGGNLAFNDRAQSRLAGYKAALTEAGLPVRDSLIRTCHLEAGSGVEAASSLLEGSHQVDAIFVASDIVALGVLIECQKRDYSVPEDIAIFGFDDAQIASIINPSLSTIVIPRQKMGESIAAFILSRLKGKEIAGKTMDLGFSLALRETA